MRAFNSFARGIVDLAGVGAVDDDSRDSIAEGAVGISVGGPNDIAAARLALDAAHSG